MTDGILLDTQKIPDAPARRGPAVTWPLVVAAVTGIAVFVALTVAVTTNPSLSLDSNAFETANDLRTPWLDQVAKLVTKLGLIAIVGPAVVLAAWLLVIRRHRIRAAALVLGSALAWGSVWLAKILVDRPRPPAPVIHTAGQSYPSAHAANSVGWLALAIALTAVIPILSGRVAAIVAGSLLAVLVGLTRIYLRAHYASDVLAGEALAVAMYALAAIGATAWQAHHVSATGGQASSSPLDDLS